MSKEEGAAGGRHHKTPKCGCRRPFPTASLLAGKERKQEGGRRQEQKEKRPRRAQGSKEGDSMAVLLAEQCYRREKPESTGHKIRVPRVHSE